MLSDVTKVHLVFPENSTGVVEELSKYCLITGWDNSLEEVSNWAREGGGADPDIFLLNCAPFFVPKSTTVQNSVRNKSLSHLKEIRKFRRKSRIIALFPQVLSLDLQLITELLHLKIYDFWFFDDFDQEDIKTILSTRRTREGVEKYVRSLDIEKEHFIQSAFSDAPWKKFIFSPAPRVEQIYKPYYIKTNIISFWTADDAFLSQGMALLLAANLAENGFKTALIEPVSSLPSLAGSLSMRHPYFNTSHALSMFSQGNNGFIKNCLFNTEKYFADPHSPDKENVILDFPPELYFLPDLKKEDNIPRTEMNKYWKAFVTELCRIIIFEQGFHFVIFTSAGKNEFNDLILNELSYSRFITVNMLPSSILFGINERKKSPGSVHIIGTKQVRFIEQEIRDLGVEPFLYPPKTFEEDLMHYLYSKRRRGFTEDTRRFIHGLTEKTGVMLIKETRSIKLGIQKLKNIFRSSL